MTRLFLVRHAHADWRPGEARPLSKRGRHASTRVAELLAPADIAAIYSSPARRAVETIEPLADRTGLRPIIVNELRERELPVQPAREFAEVVRHSWLHPDEAPFGGESLMAAQARGLHAIRTVASRHRDKGVVVATHGNLLALVVNGLDSAYGYDFWRRMTFPDVYELQFRESSPEGIRRVWDEAAQQEDEGDER
jgi:2,3-bisphosphoglycerate-dependent phosphoglycerate mutase